LLFGGSAAFWISSRIGLPIGAGGMIAAVWLWSGAIAGLGVTGRCDGPELA